MLPRLNGPPRPRSKALQGVGVEYEGWTRWLDLRARLKATQACQNFGLNNRVKLVP